MAECKAPESTSERMGSGTRATWATMRGTSVVEMGHADKITAGCFAPKGRLIRFPPTAEMMTGNEIDSGPVDCTENT